MRDSVIDIPNENPFENDQFNREVIARNFMKIFKNDEIGIILAIDSSWGTGKTTFIKMWESLINNNEDYKNNYETLYFNAWENDYMKDPLLALLVEFEISKEKGVKEAIKNIADGGKKFLSTLGDITVKVASAGSLESADLNFKRNDIEKLYPELSKSIGSEILENTIKLKNIREIFKEDIDKTIENTDKKIIIFIDELDRCRPTFAIELLENIKHIFSTSGVIFVISLDKEQLSHSIATVYGQNMDANGYLRRFFDLDYKLANPDIFNYFGIKSKGMFNKYENIEYLNQFLKTFILEYNLSLRDVDKLCEYLKIILPMIDEIKGNFYNYNPMRKIVNIFIYSYLIVLKIKHPDLYTRIATYSYNQDSITDIFKLENISNMDFNIRGMGKISNEKILSVIKSDVIEKYLKLNLLARNNPNKVYNMEDYEYMVKEERYSYVYNLAGLFDNSGNCRLRKNIDFLNDFNI